MTEKPNIKMDCGLTIEEQEVIINFDRTDIFASLYTSDPNIALRASKNKQFEFVQQDQYGYWFKVDKKFLIKGVFRKKREYPPERLEQMKKTFLKSRQEKTDLHTE